MSGSFVVQEQSGAVLLLTLNRPERANAFESTEQALELAAALNRADADDSVRAIVLTGAGKAFCAGGDVDAMCEGRGMFGQGPLEQREAYRSGIQRVPMTFEAMETPVIAAVNGAAMGAGCDIATMCDIRIASETAIFSQAFVRLGLISGDGGAYFLPRIIGQANALRLALTGETIDAQQALSWGLVSQVTAPKDLLDVCMRLAATIAAHPPHAVRMTRKLFMGSPSRTLAETLEMSAAFQAICHQSPAHREAVAALAARRNKTRSVN